MFIINLIKRVAESLRKTVRRHTRYLRIHRAKFFYFQRQFEPFPGTETKISVTPTENKQAILEIMNGSDLIVEAILGMSNAGIYIRNGRFKGESITFEKESPILLPRDHVCHTDTIIQGRVRKPVFDILLELQITTIPLRSDLLVDNIDTDIVQDNEVHAQDIRGCKISFRSENIWNEANFSAEVYLSAYTHAPIALYTST